MTLIQVDTLYCTHYYRCVILSHAVVVRSREKRVIISLRAPPAKKNLYRYRIIHQAFSI